MWLKSLTGIEKYAFLLGNEIYYELNDIIMDDIRKRIEMISPLNEKEQMALLDSGYVELVQQYFDKRKLQLKLSDEAEIRLVRSENVAVMKIYRRYFYLSEKAELELVKTANFEMIKAYLGHGTFVSRLAEIEFIKLENVEMIKSYMNKGRFSEESQDALIKLGNARLVECYCCHWGFCDKLKGEAREVLERHYAKAE